MKFKSFAGGYGFCGKTGKCQCAKVVISAKVSMTKQNKTEEENKATNAKRAKTTLAKYGVNNNGQTPNAKINHAALYNDNDAVTTIVSKIAKTKFIRYGDKHYNNASKIKETFASKEQNGFWIEKFKDKEIAVLNNKESMQELYKKHSIIELAEKFNVHTQTVYKYLNKHGLRQPFKSAEEHEIVGYLESLGIKNIVCNSRKVITPKELDIYLPDYNIAIEFNGVYWHHEDIQHITKTYHSDKYQQCKLQGIQLITIFSTFWHGKKDIVKSIIKAKLQLNSESVYARKCSIAEIDATESKLFQDTYHIQGHTRSKIKYGLRYNNELVALMTFSETKSRPGIGKKEPGYELIRFVSSRRVQGGASKLLKHFIKNHNPEQIISYSDNEWSDGDLYKQLGFKNDKKIIPSYWYVKHRVHKLFHRYNFAKFKLVEQGYDASLTEREITKQMGLLKVWDCGKIRWVLKGI